MADGRGADTQIDSDARGAHERAVVAEAVVAAPPRRGEVLTGLIYINNQLPTLLDTLNLTKKPLATLTEAELRPSRETLAEINQRYRV